MVLTLPPVPRPCRQEKPEVRQASRDAALREVKERAKKLKAEKASKQVGGLGRVVKRDACQHIVCAHAWGSAPPNA